MADGNKSPAIDRLMALADKALAAADRAQAARDPAAAICCALVAQQYLNAARAIERMNEAAARP